MRLEDTDEIRRLALFRDCGDDTFDTLIRAGFLQRFPPGVVLIHENDPADFLYIVVEGMVEMFATQAGRETTIGFIEPIGTFILAAVLKDQVYLQSARTLEKSRVLMIPAENVRAAMRDDTAFMNAIVTELATCYRSVVKDLKCQKLRTGTERLANWLLRADRADGASGTVELRVGKRVLASRLGMTPENLSRAFATLGAYGVEVDGPTIHLRDVDDLTKFAKPSPLIDDYST
ncbi:cyclic nucleotide-binding domain-containing protein [Microbaculum marinisediminis]|uniref:Cyclic nucleotide-binding domain-containing protein n=1 Tax=Microbaculum marinisediminis TaxID=2931392 RepID=A0AAW5R0B2_9HYPH|nr:cyclic nucleotide-binding domain-containing protein [Microbaculum sp. A6E488]MCT8973622.1 cyclic nucleotide-binding domain-containing protein [Microbaculum sp. A6E488]